MNSSFKGMFNGDFFKKKSILSDADISSLQAYNAEIQRGVRPNIAFYKTMRESSVAAQNMAKSAKGAAVNLNAIPKVSRAATLGIKALSVAMNVGLMVGITTLISGITKMVGASEEMSQQASEATSKYKEQTSSIEEYKDKITELKTALSSENLTYADARDKRNQLLEVQKQLIDTYGDEAKGIDLVNGSLDSQIDKLEELNKQKRQEWENEVNKLSAGQQWQKWGGFAGLTALALLKPQEWFTNKTAIDWLNNFDNTTNIERIQKKVENFSKSIKFGSISDELKSQLDSFEGVSFDGLKMTISGDAKTVSETVTQIQTQVIGSREDLQWLNQDLKDIYNSAKKIVDENWDTYNTALQNQILDDKTGLEYYGKLIEAYETYQEAVKDGDENTINEAKEGYAKILSDIAGSDMSDSFKKFFENMYPDISDIVDDWKFEVDIVPKINTNKDGLKDDIETVKGLTTEEISAAFENNGTGVTKDQWKAITDLNAEAQANGLDLTTFLEQLREAGYLVSQLDKDIEKAVNDTKNKYGDGVDWGKYFKDNSIDTQEEIDKWNEVTKGIDNAEDAMNAYAEATKNANKMTVSEKELEKQVKILKNRIDKITQSLSEYTKQLELLKKAQDSLYEKDYINKLDYINQRYKIQGKHVETAKQELDGLLSTVPANAEGWETLATAVEKVSKEYFEGKRALIDYQVEMSQAYMDALKASSEFSSSVLDESLSQYDRNAKMLTEGGLGGLQFSLTPVTPQDAIENQREENEKLLKEEQIYQEKVDAIKRRALDEQLKTINKTVATIETDTTDTIEDLGQKGIDTYDKVKDHIENSPIKPEVDWDIFGTKDSSGSTIVDEAMKYLGTPYLWGGITPLGFDCSGFVQYAYDKAGIEIPRTADEQYKASRKITIDELQPGDLIFTDFKNGVASHVGMYVGDEKVLSASSSSGKVVEQDFSNYWKSGKFGRMYASGTKDYGVAGENYKKEFLIDKKTGQWTEVNSPTLIDTNEVDVVGEKASAKINKPLPMYADGTLTNQELLNIIKAVSEESGVPANVLAAVAQQETGGKWYDKVSDGTGYSYGYMMLYDNGVIADLKAQGRSETAEKAKVDPYTNVAVAAEYLKKFYEQGGDWKYAFGRYNGSGTNGDYARQVYERMNSSEYTQALQNIGTITTNTTQIRRSFDSQFRDFIEGSNSTSNSTEIENSLMDYIRNNTKVSSESTEKFVEAFEGLNNYKDSMEPYFKERAEEVRNAAGTPEFAALTSAYNKDHSEYIETIMGYSTDMNVAQAKSQYKLAEDGIKKGYEFYNERKNAGASASELMEIATKIGEIEKVAEEYSDAYVNAISAETDFLVSRTERTLNAFDNEMSWLDKDLEKAEGNTTKQAEIYGKKNDVSKRAMDAAHQRVLDIRKDEDYADILAAYDVESWFDASGELTSKFYEDVEGASSELIPYMNQFAEIVGVCKKDWYENAEAIESNNEAMADLKIDEYIKYQERLIESLDFDATLNQSLSSAKKSMYDFIDTLREEKMEMDKQLKANMQIDDWLTEDTRKQLFNLDDYEEQMGVINELQADSESLYLKYQNDLANLKEDELYKEEEITAEYNRQMEALQDKLGIAKAELQLAKDKAAFENALLERDTQIIMGNRVQNVADPERLRDAAEKLAESENELINQQTKKTEADDIRLMEHETGLINLEKGAIQNRVDMINEMSDEEKRAFADFLEPIDVISAKLTTLSKVNPDRIIRGDNSNSVYLSRDFSKMAGYSLSTDHSGIVDLMDNLFNNGYFKEGTDAYEVAQLIKQWSKYQHDDKTTSDAHNYGYDLYDPENAYLWGRGALTMYSDEVFKTFAQEYVPIYEYMSNLMSKAVTNALENTPIVSGEGDVIFANSGTTVADILKDYQEASIEELFTRLTNDPEKAQSLVESFKVGSIAPSADALKSLSDLFAKAVAVDVMNGNGNSTVIMENVNVTLEKQPQNVNSFVANLTEKTMTEFDLTKNR